MDVVVFVLYEVFDVEGVVYVILCVGNFFLVVFCVELVCDYVDV